MKKTMDPVMSLLQFIKESPTPYHAIRQARESLEHRSCQWLEENADWKLLPGHTYGVIRDGGSLVAFTLPQGKAPSKLPNFRIIGAHTDSPALKLKPRPLRNVANYQQWGVEVYGGALWNSWLDRDLGIAGQVSFMRKGKLVTELVTLDSPLCRIPQLAVHLDREVNEKGLKLNPEEHLVPVCGLTGDKKIPLERQMRQWLRAQGLPLGDQNPFTFDLFLADSEAPALGGCEGELIYASRLDNLAMSHAALTAFMNAGIPRQSISVTALFNHEEVGSKSSSGAGSHFLIQVLERVALALGQNRNDFLRSLANSFFISADMAHAVHPNYSERHSKEHWPLLNHGPVLKGNAGIRYATDSRSALFFTDLCRKARVPVQNFVGRADLGCGSTIGPVLAADLGVPVVDVGNPMLSMHSVREMAATKDHLRIIKVFQKYFQ